MRCKSEECLWGEGIKEFPKLFVGGAEGITTPALHKILILHMVSWKVEEDVQFCIEQF